MCIKHQLMPVPLRVPTLSVVIPSTIWYQCYGMIPVLCALVWYQYYGMISVLWYDTSTLIWYQYHMIPVLWYDTSTMIWYQPVLWYDTSTMIWYQYYDMMPVLLYLHPCMKRNFSAPTRSVGKPTAFKFYMLKDRRTAPHDTSQTSIANRQTSMDYQRIVYIYDR